MSIQLLSVLMLFQGNAFWKLVRNLLKTPTKEQIECQKPKPVLLDTGEMKRPYDWAVSSILDIFLLPTERLKGKKRLAYKT